MMLPLGRKPRTLGRLRLLAVAVLVLSLAGLGLTVAGGAFSGPHVRTATVRAAASTAQGSATGLRSASPGSVSGDPTVYNDPATCAQQLAAYAVDFIENPPSTRYVGTDGLVYYDSMAVDKNGYKVQMQTVPNRSSQVDVDTVFGPDSGDPWRRTFIGIAQKDFIFLSPYKAHDAELAASTSRLLPVCAGAMADRANGKSPLAVDDAVAGLVYSHSADKSSPPPPVATGPETQFGGAWNTLPHPWLDCTALGAGNRTQVDAVTSQIVQGQAVTFVSRACLTGDGSGADVVAAYTGTASTAHLIGTMLSDKDRATAITITVHGSEVLVTAKVHLDTDPNAESTGHLERRYTYRAGSLAAA
jgi:hypothetical protein